MKVKKIQFLFLILILVILACGTPGSDGSDPAPAGQIDAKDAIQTYARDVLGLDIPNLMAGSTTGEISLPVSTQEGVEVAVNLAGTTYLGFWKEGVASLSFGDSEVSGDLIADVKDGSLGAFAVRVDQDFPQDSPVALGMILTTFPNLQGYEFFETPIEEQGFAFAAGKADDLGIQGWDITLTGTTIRAGVRPGVNNENAVVWVVVASGALATPFDQ